MSAEATLPIVTPEGVALDLALASRGDRLAAFVVDSLIIALSFAGLWVLSLSVQDAWLQALLLVAWFAVQNFYFIISEVRGGGTTIGKRRVGVRVVDARGGPLPFNAIVVRNVTRVIEVYLPVAAVISPEALLPNAPFWAQWAGVAWLVALGCLPFFNVRRQRIGDLVAGTCVIRAPKQALLPDVATERRRTKAAASKYQFTQAQLSVYGVYELQVLEDVLRIEDPVAGRRDALRAVGDRIRRKIKWPQRIPPAEIEAFLRAYYGALRAHLERRMLLGRKKKDKHSKEEDA